MVSTSIADVVEPYARLGLVRVADDPARFVEAAEQALAHGFAEQRAAVDSFLFETSWDKTWSAMARLVADIAPHSSLGKRELGVHDARTPFRATGSRPGVG